MKNNKFDLVGMTNVPEAFLALEASMGYCSIAVATDYDCWLEDPNEHVSRNGYVTLSPNNRKVKLVLVQTIKLSKQ